MAWTPEPRFPEDPEFYRRVLDRLPSPLVVVDSVGQVVYGNRALLRLAGWGPGDGVGTSILSHLHPDDVDRVTEAFLTLAHETETVTGAEELDADAVPWSAVHFRILGQDGVPIPLEVTGASALHDDVVQGVIYDVRPAHTLDLVHRTLIGSASGADVVDLLANVAATITAPPVELFAAVLEPLESSGYRVLAATDERLGDALDRAEERAMPWDAPCAEPTRAELTELDPIVRDALVSFGVEDLWHVAARSSTGSVSYRIVTAAPMRHVPDIGVRDRMRQAKELAAIVLLRAETDALLEHAATHDQLTGLLNRAGFAAAGDDALAASGTGALLFLDLDGFKPINDRHGHRAGDDVLRILGDRLRRTARSTDLIGRLGGDEFALLLRDADGRRMLPADAFASAERVLAAVGAPVTIELDPADPTASPSGPALASSGSGRRADDTATVEVSVTGSIGVVMIDGDDPFEQLLRRADDAMYVAKRDGGDGARLA